VSADVSAIRSSHLATDEAAHYKAYIGTHVATFKSADDATELSALVATNITT
jgi:hypothetical protein